MKQKKRAELYLLIRASIRRKNKEKLLKELSDGSKKVFEKEQSYTHVKNYLEGRLVSLTKKKHYGIKVTKIEFDYLIVGNWFYFKTYNIDTTDVYIEGKINLGEVSSVEDPSYKNYGTIEYVN